MRVYVDTSALAKRYLAERGSEAFEQFVASTDHELTISPLGSTEFESVLARLQRQRLCDAAVAEQARSAFARDLASALWTMVPFEAACFGRASALMRELQSPLSTLDALHLASALELRCDELATGDQQLLRAANEAGMSTRSFVI